MAILHLKSTICVPKSAILVLKTPSHAIRAADRVSRARGGIGGSRYKFTYIFDSQIFVVYVNISLLHTQTVFFTNIFRIFLFNIFIFYKFCILQMFSPTNVFIQTFFFHKLFYSANIFILATDIIFQ